MLKPADFARYHRRRELLRIAPYFVLSGAIPVIAIAMIAWRPWVVIACVLSALTIAAPGLAYLAAYLSELRCGRTVSPPGGALGLAHDVLVIRLGERETVVAIAAIAKVELRATEGLDDLRGLADVLVLWLTDGTVLRIPESCDQFWAVAGELCPRNAG